MLLTQGAVEVIVLSSAHGLAACSVIRLHRTVPALEGGATADRPAVGSPLKNGVGPGVDIAFSGYADEDCLDLGS
jgi:hypothetical protein